MEENKVKIVTHSSGFHTDDIFAVAVLSLILEKEGKDFSVTRTRDIGIIEKGDYVVDVGGIYDPSINRYDHHQQGGAGKRYNGIPYASFGLVWNRFGEELSGSSQAKNIIDLSVVQPIDAGDNGVQFLETKIEGLKPMDVGFITSIFSPTWKEEISNIDEIFIELVSYAKFLLRRIIVSASDKVEGEKYVEEAYKNASDKRLIILDNSRYPWGEVLSHLPEPLYVVYKNITDDTWSIKGVRSNLFSFKSRKDLPESWAGKSDSELEKVAGVSGAVFCHNARFMAVAKTKDAILKMAEIALNS